MAVSKRLRAEILRRDNSTCQKCGASAPNVQMVIDHVIPVALGGSDQPSNLQALCDPCNSGKSATPPDAATVARVADDAERWSRAMQAAASNMEAAHAARGDARAVFDAKWLSWGEGRPPVPRPADWERSVDEFLRAGLPLATLLECVDIAMSRRHVSAAGVFKYMCGVAWKEVRQLQKDARATLSPEVPATEAPEEEILDDAWDEVVSDLVDTLTPAEQRLHEVNNVDLRSLELDEDDRYPIATKFDAVLTDLRSDLWSLAYSVDRLLRELPDGIGERAMQLARTRMYDALEPELFTRHRFAEWAIREAVDLLHARAAKEYLDRLPANEREAWMQYAETVQSTRSAEWGYVPWREFTDDERLIHAAHHARLGEQRLTHPRMCLGTGEVIVNCPQQAAFRVLVTELECCSSATAGGGHGHPLCEPHLDRLLAQGYLNAAQEPLTVRDFWEMEAPEPEAPPF